MNIDIVSINIKGSNAPYAALKFKEDLKKQSSNPVVFCVQEVDKGAKRSQHLDVAKVIAGGDEYAFSCAMLFNPDSDGIKPSAGSKEHAWQYGTATIATNGATIRDVKGIPLGPDESLLWENSTDDFYCAEYEPRTALLVKIAALDETIWVANLHLAHTADRTASSEIRKQQISTFLEAAGKIVRPDEPMVLAGDFNATGNVIGTDTYAGTPENTDLKAFAAAGFVKMNNKVPTKITKQGLFQVDHIFYREKTTSPTGPLRVIPTNFSDHSAVTASFTFE